MGSEGINSSAEPPASEPCEAALRIQKERITWEKHGQKDQISGPQQNEFKRSYRIAIIPI